MGIRSWIFASALLSLGWMCAGTAVASEATQLVESINLYRSQVQRCAGAASAELPPLAFDTRLHLPVNEFGDLQQALKGMAYPLSSAQAISLSGPRDIGSAMTALRESFCKVVLDPQFVDVGVNHDGREWRIVLARPLMARGLDNSLVEGQKLLEQINLARGQSRQCGAQTFTASAALRWNALLATAAESHSQAMAKQNFFDHKDLDGRTPGDRAELAGYSGSQIGENIAAGQDTARKVVDGWLASPGHCANLMNPQFSELGAAYTVSPASDAEIYWTALFGAP
jgi:uncharacterized protein YkwD